MDNNKFPKGFLWGSSTNAQQFEGGWNKGGKGVSIADVRVIPGMPEESNFDDFKNAAQHYDHLEEDIALYGEMGFQTYRFSMAWTRIFPNGNDETPNQEGLDFYDKMLTELERYGIIPVCTLYAYDLPYSLVEQYGAWKSRQFIDDYLRYVDLVTKYFKGRIKYWIPFNEQNFLQGDSLYITGVKAENEKEIFRMEHHFNLAYAKATKLIHKNDPEAKTGGNIGNICVYPMTCDPRDVEAADKTSFRVGYSYGDIYARGKYSKFYLNRYRDYDLSDIILEGDLDVIASCEPDFLSLTYYMSSAVDKDSKKPLIGNVVRGKNPYCEKNEWGWTIDPYGFKHYLMDFYHRYELPILILENGLGHRDVLDENGYAEDDYRIDYLKTHIERMAEAVDEGVEIIGYLTWSATDLYSTREGFVKRYGFVSINQDTLKRGKKKSFYWYKKVIETNGEDLSNS
jgi:6-phospho-beta-glucosidase